MEGWIYLTTEDGSLINRCVSSKRSFVAQLISNRHFRRRCGMCGNSHIRAVSFFVPNLRSIRDPFRVESIAEQHYRVMNDRPGLRLSLPRLPKVSLEPKF